MTETVYIIGAGAIGKALAVCLANNGKKFFLLRGSVDDGETQRETIRATLPSRVIMEAEVTIETLSNYRRIEGIIVLCNKSYGNAALAGALKNKAGDSPIVLLQNGLGVEQAFMDFPAVYRGVLFVTSQLLSATELVFKSVAVSPIGRVVGGDDASLSQIAAVLNTGDFGFRAEHTIQPVIWKKAVVNCVFNSVCPLLDTDNGIFHRSAQAMQIAEGLVAECVAVAKGQGVQLDMKEVMDSLLTISRASDGQLISTWQDIRNRRPTEIDTLNLAIARLATTKQPIARTLLLGQLIFLKSQFTRSSQ